MTAKVAEKIIKNIKRVSQSMDIHYVEKIDIFIIDLYNKKYILQSILALEDVEIKAAVSDYLYLLINDCIKFAYSEELGEFSIIDRADNIITKSHIIDLRNAAFRDNKKDVYYLANGEPAPIIAHNLKLGHLAETPLKISPKYDIIEIVNNFTIINKRLYVDGRFTRLLYDPFLYNYQNMDTGVKYIAFISGLNQYLFVNDKECIILNEFADCRVYAKMAEDGSLLYNSYELSPYDKEYCYKLGDDYISINDYGISVLQARKPGSGKRTKPAVMRAGQEKCE